MDEFTDLLKDLYKYEHAKNVRLTIAIIALSVILSLSLTACGFLAYELSTYEQVTIETTTTTTETYENTAEGDNANIVNGNQYNDSATHNENN